MGDIQAKANNLYDRMRDLQSTIMRVKESWNDTVATAIEANSLNTIIATTNATNGEMRALTKRADDLYEEIIELERRCPGKA